MKLKDKVCVITGAASGIGRASAFLFASEGGKIVVVDKDDRGKSVAEEMENSIFVKADVSKSEDALKIIERTMKKFGKIDVMFNNAGVEISKKITETNEEEWDKVLDVNLKGVFLCSRYAIPIMIENGGGVIVNTASELGLVGGHEIAAYSASKGGVVLLTKSMALDYAENNIRVNCICPGPIKTPLLSKIIKNSENPEKEEKNILNKVPMGRFGTPSEIAKGALYLASDDSSFVTGSCLVIDGGWSAQ